MSNLSKLLASELSTLSSYNKLKKVAELRKKAVEIPSWAPKLLRHLYNWGPVAAGGATGAYTAHNLGADPFVSAMSGIGFASVSSPRRWKDIIEEGAQAGRLGRDPYHAFSRSAIKDLAWKTGLVGGSAMADKGVQIMNNISDTTQNVANQTRALTTGNPSLITKSINNANALGYNTAGFFNFDKENPGPLKTILDKASKAGPPKVDVDIAPETKKFLERAGLIGGGAIGGGMLLSHLLKKHNKEKEEARLQQ